MALLTRSSVYLSLISLVLLCLFSCKQDKVVEPAIEKPALRSVKVDLIDTLLIFNPDTKKEETKITREKVVVYTVPNQLPVLKTCGKLASLEGRYECSNKALMNYVASNLKYPEDAYQNEIEGVSMVSFIITEEGIPIHEKIVKSIGYGTDEEVLSLIAKMRNEQMRWDPGFVKGEKVKVMQTLPVRFRIN